MELRGLNESIHAQLLHMVDAEQAPTMSIIVIITDRFPFTETSSSPSHPLKTKMKKQKHFPDDVFIFLAKLLERILLHTWSPILTKHLN